jgi:hypothetical protein
MGAASFSTKKALRPEPSTFDLSCRRSLRNSCRFEQAFCDDGGKAWEVNWIARHLGER